MKAAIYLRSSKDRSDVSISSQRKELIELAHNKKLEIIEEFVDVVESAKNANRPSFQRLITELKNSNRKWEHLLFVDTSRLSRGRYVAQVFKRQCKKLGVTILYSKLPETDPIATIILESVFEAMDEVHSLMSKEKGLAGMRENVMQGFRAGGRAPKGYKLKKIETGAIRDGSPVTKSVLELSDEHLIIKRYLKERAKGRAAEPLCRELELNIPKSTRTGMEWNALTYAGHTVWNVHNENVKGEGYQGKPKRKPRTEWVINKNTHPALITNNEAEIILSRLEEKNTKRAKRATYLLSGLLKTPLGESWHSNGEGYYRVKGKKIKIEKTDQAILNKIETDMQSKEFITKITALVTNYAKKHETDPTLDLKISIDNINIKISKLMDMALEMDDRAPVMRKINDLENNRKSLQNEIDLLEKEHRAASIMANIKQSDIFKIMSNFTQDLKETNPNALKDKLYSLIDRIELTPDTLECNIKYSMNIGGVIGASPRGFEPLLPP